MLTLVNDNQIVLRPFVESRIPTEQANVSSILLVSAADVSFSDNQCEVDSDIAFTASDLISIGTSLRVNSNRLQKRLDGGLVSAITLGLMNQTTMNQSTHCVVGLAPLAGRVVDWNRSLASMSSEKLCSHLDAFAIRFSSLLSSRANATAIS